MIKHDIVIMGLKTIKKNSTNKVDHAIIDDAIKIIKHDSEIVKDVKRYFETTDMVEWSELGLKLSKVGVKDV